MTESSQAHEAEAADETMEVVVEAPVAASGSDVLEEDRSSSAVSPSVVPLVHDATEVTSAAVDANVTANGRTSPTAGATSMTNACAVLDGASVARDSSADSMPIDINTTSPLQSAATRPCGSPKKANETLTDNSTALSDSISKNCIGAAGPPVENDASTTPSESPCSPSSRSPQQSKGTSSIANTHQATGSESLIGGTDKPSEATSVEGKAKRGENGHQRISDENLATVNDSNRYQKASDSDHLDTTSAMVVNNSNGSSGGSVETAQEAIAGNDVEKMDICQNEEEKQEMTGDDAPKPGANEPPAHEEKKRLIRESPCGNDCTNSCNSKFSDEQRIRIYDLYWSFQNGSEEQQKWMERHCIDKAIPKVSSKSLGAARNRTFVYLYFLPQPDDKMQKLRVCKKYLAATLGITERMLSGFVYRFVGSAGLDLEDGDWSPAAGYEGCSREQIFFLREFIQGLPASPVHYCRNEQCTRKLYELPASIPDVSTLFGMYSSAEESLQREPVDESIFRAVLHQDYNLGFSSSTRGDICNVREYRKGVKK